MEFILSRIELAGDELRGNVRANWNAFAGSVNKVIVVVAVVAVVVIICDYCDVTFFYFGGLIAFFEYDVCRRYFHCGGRQETTLSSSGLIYPF